MIRLMVVLKAHFDGKVIVPDEPVSFAPNQKLRVSVETDETATPIEPPTDKPRRAAGFAKHLNITMSDDFNDPLKEFEEYM
jgi:hypothetical protein